MKIQVKSHKYLVKARFSEIYLKKFHINYYYFYQQYKNYLKILVAIKINHILFTISFLHDIISLK